MTVYEIVKELCTEKHLSIRKLEILSGLGNGTIGGWRESVPRTDKLMAVSKTLGVSVSTLLKGVK